MNLMAVVGVAPKLKYEQGLATRPDQPCPCHRFHKRNQVAWRFLRSPATEDDFLPIALLDGLKPKDKCDKFALSFFASFEEAERRWHSLADRFGQKLGDRDAGIEAAINRYGDHCGEINLVEDDGLQDDPDPRSGHIGLHEFDGVSFVGRVTTYRALVSAPLPTNANNAP